MQFRDDPLLRDHLMEFTATTHSSVLFRQSPTVLFRQSPTVLFRQVPFLPSGPGAGPLPSTDRLLLGDPSNAFLRRTLTYDAAGQRENPSAASWEAPF
ncbi:hypothetical protein TNCT_20181 [Trichonephila clavata]|uniref:Uncharacterized protein n=1 Tax=Trichonephila clavata TaxID=2740835 RepID=A0A8X6HCP9_TRICU|nr:hypothetical protein TNCT_17031 [Trichonephila clavata]GFQ72885.1 hypothetical protein TNCT_6521 [Trichonephila clavata]GFQ95078.1 hypothetical protein TNCT_354631 [Trichonephila clavata]GFR20953.1 hypothetical protein TNCT_20181 [Trichonephila clavata]